MSYDPLCIDKTLPRGNSRRFRLTVSPPSTGSDPDPTPIDLTGALVTFEMKVLPDTYKGRLPPTDPVVVRKTSDDANEIEVLTQAGDTLGQCLIKMLPDDTKFLNPGPYAYSVDVTTAVGDTYTVVIGKMYLQAPATAAENLTPPD